MTTSRRIIAMIAAAAGLATLTACGIGQPMAVIPEPESQLTPKPGLLTDDNGEWVIYRKP
jgi:predicted small lipoprotein YifL